MKGSSTKRFEGSFDSLLVATSSAKLRSRTLARAESAETSYFFGCEMVKADKATTYFPSSLFREGTPLPSGAKQTSGSLQNQSL